MARRYSRVLPLGTPAPRFALRDTVSGRTVALEDFASSGAADRLRLQSLPLREAHS